MAEAGRIRVIPDPFGKFLEGFRQGEQDAIKAAKELANLLKQGRGGGGRSRGGGGGGGGGRSRGGGGGGGGGRSRGGGGGGGAAQAPDYRALAQARNGGSRPVPVAPRQTGPIPSEIKTNLGNTGLRVPSAVRAAQRLDNINNVQRTGANALDQLLQDSRSAAQGATGATLGPGSFNQALPQTSFGAGLSGAASGVPGSRLSAPIQASPAQVPGFDITSYLNSRMPPAEQYGPPAPPAPGFFDRLMGGGDPTGDGSRFRPGSFLDRLFGGQAPQPAPQVNGPTSELPEIQPVTPIDESGQGVLAPAVTNDAEQFPAIDDTGGTQDVGAADDGAVPADTFAEAEGDTTFGESLADTGLDAAGLGDLGGLGEADLVATEEMPDEVDLAAYLDESEAYV